MAGDVRRRVDEGSRGSRATSLRNNRNVVWDFPVAILTEKKKVPVRVPSSAPVHRPHPIPARPIRGRGGKSKNLQLTGTSLRPAPPRTAAIPASRRRAATYARHAHPTAALDGTATAQSVARLRHRRGLQLSSGLQIRCTEPPRCRVSGCRSACSGAPRPRRSRRARWPFRSLSGAGPLHPSGVLDRGWGDLEPRVG